MFQDEETPQGWQRDGSLLYTAQEYTLPTSKKKAWFNRLTVKIDGHQSYVDETEKLRLAERLHAFLSAPTPASSVLVGEGAENPVRVVLEVLNDWLEENEATDFDEHDVAHLFGMLGAAGYSILPNSRIDQVNGLLDQSIQQVNESSAALDEAYQQVENITGGVLSEVIQVLRNAAAAPCRNISDIEYALALLEKTAARPAPLSLLGSGDAVDNSIAIYGEWEMGLRQRIEAERMDWTEVAECVAEIPRLFKIIDALRSELGRSGGEIHDLKKSLSAAASTGGGAAEIELSDEELGPLLDGASEYLGDLYPPFTDCDEKAMRLFIDYAKENGISIARAAAPQHLVVGEAAGQWVPVGERLPVPQRKVLILLKPGERHGHDAIEIGYFVSYGDAQGMAPGHWSTWESLPFDDVIGWQELPFALL